MADQQSSGPDDALARRFMRLASGFARDRAVTATMLVEFGHAPLWVHIRHGRVARIDDAPPPLASWDFAVRAAADVWERFWRAVPEPGSHDIFALAKRADMRIEGNLHPFMCHLQYVKDLLAVGRAEAS